MLIVLSLRSDGRWSSARRTELILGSMRQLGFALLLHGARILQSGSDGLIYWRKVSANAVPLPVADIPPFLSEEVEELVDSEDGQALDQLSDLTDIKR